MQTFTEAIEGSKVMPGDYKFLQKLYQAMAQAIPGVEKISFSQPDRSYTGDITVLTKAPIQPRTALRLMGDITDKLACQVNESATKEPEVILRSEETSKIYRVAFMTTDYAKGMDLLTASMSREEIGGSFRPEAPPRHGVPAQYR